MPRMPHWIHNIHSPSDQWSRSLSHGLKTLTSWVGWATKYFGENSAILCKHWCPTSFTIQDHQRILDDSPKMNHRRNGLSWNLENMRTLIQSQSESKIDRIKLNKSPVKEYWVYCRCKESRAGKLVSKGICLSGPIFPFFRRCRAVEKIQVNVKK